MISERFTIEDIHKIRYENYEKTKHLLPNELIEDTNRRAEKVIKRLNDIKNKKNCITDKVEMIVRDGQIVIIPIENPREGWDEIFKDMNTSGEDKLLIEENLNEGVEDWEW